MATAIIIVILIAICITAVKCYMKKLAHGCCGAGGDNEKSDKTKPNLSDCKYRYTIYIVGMSCKNCAARIENAFSRQGIYAQADFKNGTAEIYSQESVAEFTVRQTIIGLGYSVERIEGNEL
ncbi:MAG: cation transporter [Oscillospiraceae bacterium]